MPRPLPRGALFGALALALPAAPAQAGGIFEVVHPDIRAGGFELEALNTLSLGGVDAGEPRAAHELALSYGFAKWWKSVAAVELVDPKGGGYEVEALELGNLFMLPLGGGHGHSHDHGHGHDHGHDHGGGFALGVFQGLEIPNAGGLSEGALSLGPVAEARLGPLQAVGNLFLEVPFADGADPGLAYALQLRRGIGHGLALGAEAHGGVEEAFGDAPGWEDQEHYAGPALFAELDLGDGRVLEPRAALLFGMTEASADAALSVNFELKF